MAKVSVSKPGIEAIILIDGKKRSVTVGNVPSGELHSVGFFPSVKLAQAAARQALGATPDAVGFATRTVRRRAAGDTMNHGAQS